MISRVFTGVFLLLCATVSAQAADDNGPVRQAVPLMSLQALQNNTSYGMKSVTVTPATPPAPAPAAGLNANANTLSSQAEIQGVFKTPSRLQSIETLYMQDKAPTAPAPAQAATPTPPTVAKPAADQVEAEKEMIFDSIKSDPIKKPQRLFTVK